VKTGARNTGVRVLIVSGVAGLFAFAAWKLGIPLPSPKSIHRMFEQWEGDPLVGPHLVEAYLLFVFTFGCFGFPRGPVAVVGIGLIGKWNTYLAYTLLLPVSALIQFGAGRWAIADWVRERLPPQARQWEERLVRHGFLAVAGLRAFPFTPMGTFNYLCAVSELSPATFFLGSFAGYAVSNAFDILLAQVILDLYLHFWDWEWAGPVLAASVILFVGLGVTVYSRLERGRRRARN